MKLCPNRFNLPEPECIGERCVMFVPEHTVTTPRLEFPSGFYSARWTEKKQLFTAYCKLYKVEVKQ